MSEAIKMKGGAIKGDAIAVDDLDALSAADPVVAAAAAVMRDAIAGLATYNLVLAHEIASLGIPVFTRDIPTMAVTIGGDGIVRWLVNPEFVVELGDVDTMFVICHEVDHVVLAHLANDESLGNDEQGRLAAEVVINHRVSRLLKRDSVPTKDGKPNGVCPKQVHGKYRKAVADAGKTPATYEEFTSNDIACAAYLREMPAPPKQQHICMRGAGEPIPGAGDPNAGDGDGDKGQSPSKGLSGVDPETSGKIVDDVLNQLMTRALRGDKAAKETLLDLGERLGEDNPIWGNLGLGALRGETPPPREVTFWEQYLVGAITSVLVAGAKLVYPRDMVGFDELFEEAGFRIPFQSIGDETHTNLGCYVDTSGSMGDETVRRVAALAGTIPNCTVHWHAFDADVYPFEPGQPLKGGGGTSFDIVREHAEGRDEDPFDCILVLTDGFAPHISPSDPDRWVWLVTPNGDMWPADNDMFCVEIDLPPVA